MESNPFFEQDEIDQQEVPATATPATSPAAQTPSNPFDDESDFQSSAFSSEDVFGKQEPEKTETKPPLPPKPKQETVNTEGTNFFGILFLSPYFSLSFLSSHFHFFHSFNCNL